MIIDTAVEIKNMINGARPGWIVARLVDGEFWYYGNYGEDKDRAMRVANEIDNGVVIGYKIEGEV